MKLALRSHDHADTRLIDITFRGVDRQAPARAIKNRKRKNERTVMNILSRFPGASVAPEEFLWPRADAVCTLALLRSDKAAGSEDLALLYLRAPQAVREKEARNG